VTKAERIAIFIQRLRECAPVGSHAAALQLICETMNQVEDEFSGARYQPENWRIDGRMYPPDATFAHRVEGSSTVEYRATAHSTFIGANGAFVILRRSTGQVLLAMPGLDGRGVLPVRHG
jgi:hypothetical protein